MGINSRKVVVVGCGFVGSSSAFALMQSQLFSEMVLIDADQKRAEGEAIDISHGMVRMMISVMLLLSSSQQEQIRNRMRQGWI